MKVRRIHGTSFEELNQLAITLRVEKEKLT
jgi:hypothetical protein